MKKSRNVSRRADAKDSEQPAEKRNLGEETWPDIRQTAGWQRKEKTKHEHQERKLENINKYFTAPSPVPEPQMPETETESDDLEAYMPDREMGD